MSRSRTLTVQIAGGLGNQLFQYYAGYLASVRSQRKLILDDSRISSGVFYDNRINAEMPQLGLKGLSGLDATFISQTSLSRALSQNAIARRVPLYRKTQKLLDFSPNGETGTDLTLKQFDIGESRITNIRLKGNLQSLELVQAAINLGAFSVLQVLDKGEYAEKLLKLCLETRPIGIHLRLRDYSNSKELLELGTEYYIDGITRIRSKIPNSPLWLFSDDVELAFKLLPKKITQDVCLVVNPSDLSDVETLLIMSKCEGLVIANSTFSFWGGFFSKSQSIVAPSPWFKKGLSLKEDLDFNLPSHWQKLSR